jgi:FkbM family methyltransferase
MYSQNLEEKYILEYFSGMQPGTLLSIGENDGHTFSNSLALIQQGWGAVLIEPMQEAFVKMKSLHVNNPNVICLNIAISGHDGAADFYQSGSHLGNGDSGLLSTLNPAEMKRWKREKFNKTTVNCFTYSTLRKQVVPGIKVYEFITIDAEGMDMVILKQINLSYTFMLCIEWNGNFGTRSEILNYCKGFGMKTILYENGENLLIVR